MLVGLITEFSSVARWKSKNRLERIVNIFLEFSIYKLKILNFSQNYNHVMQSLGLQPLDAMRKLTNLKFLKSLLNEYLDSPRLISKLNFHISYQVTLSRNIFHILEHRMNHETNNPIIVLQKFTMKCLLK